MDLFNEDLRILLKYVQDFHKGGFPQPQNNITELLSRIFIHPP